MSGYRIICKDKFITDPYPNIYQLIPFWSPGVQNIVWEEREGEQRGLTAEEIDLAFTIYRERNL